MHSVEDFIKLASPHIEYIEESQAYLDSQRYAPYNSWPVEGIDKEATLRALGRTAANVGGTMLNTLVTRPLAGTMKTLGRWFSRAPKVKLTENGNMIVTRPGNYVPGGAEKSMQQITNSAGDVVGEMTKAKTTTAGRIGHWLTRRGTELGRWGNRSRQKLLRQMNYVNPKNEKAMEELGFWGRMGNRAKGAVPATLGGSALVAGAMGVPGFKQAFDVGWYGTPVGLTMEGINMASDKIGQGIGAIKEKAMQGAEEAAMRTAQEIANGIYDQGRMGHLYGVIDPDGFKERLLTQAQQGIRDKFTQLRGGATV